MYATLIVVAALWGAAAGLPLSRAAYRLSVEPDTAWRGTCPAGHPFTGPAGGWLGGPRCAACSRPADARAADVPPADAGDAGTAHGGRGRGAPGAVGGYLPVLLSCLVCLALAAATGARPELAVWLLLAPFGVLLALVDLAVRRLPDLLTLPLAGAAALLLGSVALLPGAASGSWGDALLGGLVLGACYLVLHLVNPAGLGFGDVKLALALGVVLGWYGWLVLFAGAFAGFLLGSLYGLGAMLHRRTGRGTTIPLGPFMLAGALLGLMLGGAGAR